MKKLSLKSKKELANTLYDQLLAIHGPQVCFLHHKNAYELLISVILSAQCTDNVVNKQTPALFTRYPTPKDLSAASIEEVEALIKKIGLYKAKSKNIIRCAQQLCEDFNEEVPNTIEKLITLAGVGRKTANVVIADAFGVPGLAVDTHVKRLSNRLGLVDSEDPTSIEHALKKLLPAEKWASFSHLLIVHGRTYCKAQSPQCQMCPLK